MAVAPTVTQEAISKPGITTAVGIGNVTSLGDSAVTAHGVCWNTTGMPTTADSKVDNGAKSATGRYQAYISGLASATKYYARAYATNTTGASYSEEVSFTTSAYFVYIVDNHLLYKDEDSVERVAVAADLIATFDDTVISHEDNVVYT